MWLVWVCYGAFWFGFAGLVGGTVVFAVLGVVAVIVFLLASWPLVYWLRGRAWADTGMMLAIAAVAAVVVVRFPLWLCEPLGYSGFASAQVCTGRLYAEGRGGARHDPRIAVGWYRRAAEAGNAEAQYLLATSIHVRQQT